MNTFLVYGAVGFLLNITGMLVKSDVLTIQGGLIVWMALIGYTVVSEIKGK